MKTRFICNVLCDMRAVQDALKNPNSDKEDLIDFLADLIEEAQYLANKMEKGLKRRQDFLKQYELEDEYKKQSNIVNSYVKL